MHALFSKQLVLLALLAISIQCAGVARAAERTRCFPETGYCVAGPILDYWEQHGGLPVFGYPITEQRIETVEGSWHGRVQWFERDRLEDHGLDGVLAGRLGDRFLKLAGIDWQQLPGDTAITRGCRFFRETQFNLCQPFLGYWERNGGLARFGYPITRMRQEHLEGGEYIVQYFERRRMEYHPENAGTSFEVLRGLLGRDVMGRDENSGSPCTSVSPALQRTWAQYAADLGCGQLYGSGRLATQPFEHGEMVWVERGDGAPGQIFMIIAPPYERPYWSLAIDSYIEGEPIGTDELPPPGKYVPVRGFGKLWRQSPDLRQALGWATAPERAESGTTLQFSGEQGFSWMIYRVTLDRVYMLRAAPTDTPVINTARLP
jgi:hypothetical protein